MTEPTFDALRDCLEKCAVALEAHGEHKLVDYINDLLDVPAASCAECGTTKDTLVTTVRHRKTRTVCVPCFTAGRSK